jgi:hydroxyacylglutathione hydrolase
MPKPLIHLIPALSDNYIFALEYNGSCIIVDPSDAKPVLAFLKKMGLPLTGILITHHHFDHIAGCKDILTAFPAPVFGPSDKRIPFVTNPVAHETEFTIDTLPFLALATPGHTKTHHVYYCKELISLFSGDTLFGCGCGRVLEGTPNELYSSLMRIRQLPKETSVYCAHEYTADNIAFAVTVDPTNADLISRAQSTRKLREKKIPTIPFTLDLEEKTNSFFRTNSQEIRRHVGLNKEGVSDEEVFSRLRKMKDGF